MLKEGWGCRFHKGQGKHGGVNVQVSFSFFSLTCILSHAYVKGCMSGSGSGSAAWQLEGKRSACLFAKPRCL